jgi:WD40 repeat protein
VRLWRAATGDELANVVAGSGHVSRLAWRPDGSLIASCGADRAVRLWSARDLRGVATLGGHTDWIHGVAWSPGSRTLASCAGQADGTIRLWEAKDR